MGDVSQQSDGHHVERFCGAVERALALNMQRAAASLQSRQANGFDSGSELMA